MPRWVRIFWGLACLTFAILSLLAQMQALSQKDIAMATFYKVGFFGWMILSSIEFMHDSVLYEKKRTPPT